MIEIINPTNPIAKIPIADTFEIVLISLLVGFLATRSTLMHLLINSLVLIKKFILK